MCKLRQHRFAFFRGVPKRISYNFRNPRKTIKTFLIKQKRPDLLQRPTTCRHFYISYTPLASVSPPSPRLESISTSKLSQIYNSNAPLENLYPITAIPPRPPSGADPSGGVLFITWGRCSSKIVLTDASTPHPG
ncbi:hypothetical protein GWI33_015535 [Rhynchophorus ferrugineus]|uniref:Uncharacterized protein n=1 Tax=Rhynchophorus ferrugineus TaxID=354439 RepID=A0A834I4D0_RHYFE|nr:hypothetical protein GWI33_015535 [Rhynchophorus ferrugineus]